MKVLKFTCTNRTRRKDGLDETSTIISLETDERGLALLGAYSNLSPERLAEFCTLLGCKQPTAQDSKPQPDGTRIAYRHPVKR